MILLAGVIAAFRFFFGGETSSLDFDGDKIGIVRIEGMLTDSEEINTWIRELRDDKSVKGVVLRVNCPGGAVAPSQEIYNAVVRLTAAKPVVVSMSSLAASGGYYVSAPAHLIMANPSTITGSIGVIMEMSNLEGLFEKLGIQRQALTSGKLKDAGSPFRAMTPEDRKYLMGLIADIHEQFVADVAKARKIDINTLRPIADGRALTGNQALKAGLVDKLGGFEEAVEELKILCGLDPTKRMPVVEGPEKDEPWLRQILGAIRLDVHTDLPESGVVIR
ncbi:signal peptide peptidase SppA [Desulfovibrio ferrophilus]|uniref:Signal peptide peptidase SppA, 36K type n=1 Tax=Desulfovibrio ferrophilus TaxID=241368 RepID=A0A2Z6B340_9BACT|nr:signal peptide peptidase SppA [Desulfovibrio ferrophilus]BBD09912.1 signal peptide peptidase SppA, 36K type [Desulfovibrio ferrophilus]